MSRPVRQVHLSLLAGLLPAVFLILALLAYNALIERMQSGLHEQRSLALRTLPTASITQQKHYTCIFLPSDLATFTPLTGDWPDTFTITEIRRLRETLGSGTEMGIELDLPEVGPVFFWLVPVEGGYRAAIQSRISFRSRVESFRALIWIGALLLAGLAFFVYVLLARKLSDVFAEMEAKNLELERANRHLEELGKLKSNFLALVSHELRTPLARMAGHIQLIRAQDDKISPELRRRFEEMSLDIEELSRMTKNVLDLTRLQSEDLAARLDLSQVAPLVRTCVERSRPAAATRGLTIECEAPETPPVSHDPYLLERILDNLLVNAVKYSFPESTIRVLLIERESNIEICVESRGEVIPAADREKIFEKFYRIPQEADIPGSGLGLYLVRQFILMMNGRAWVEPREQGNCFIVTLPFG